jgi:CheY-specific phosphatase CheX
VNPEPTQVLKETFIEVLEQLAYMFATDVELDRVNAGVASYLQARMQFTGEPSGSVSVAVPREVAREIAANILGLEPDDPAVDRRLSDALGEVLNVTCGHLLTRLFGEEPVFTMTVPETSTLEHLRWRELLEHPDTIAVRCDEQFALLQLRLSQARG